MSFREKAAWIAVLTTLPVWGYYFFSVWQSYWALTLDSDDVLRRFLICMAITVVTLLGLNLLSAYLGKHQFGGDLDEAERAIDARANAIGGRLLEWLAVGVAAFSPWAATNVAAVYADAPVAIIGIVAANVVLLIVVFSQTIHELVHIVGHRMMN
ncbi:MAG: hypothetical protein ABIQ30_09855 [Devosia sp.]